MNGALRSSPWEHDFFWSDDDRQLAREIEHLHLDREEDLEDVSRVGKRLGELGLYRHLGRPRAMCVVREQLAFHSPLADAVFAVQGLCATPLAMSEDAAIRKTVDKMKRGERVGGFALTEPEAGSDVASMRTRARRDGDFWILDGEKTLISNVGIAHHFVVFANAAPESGKKGISAFFVPADAPGVELSAIRLSGDHPLGRIVFSSCRVPASALVGEVGHGLRLALGTLGTFRVTVGAAACGMAWRALEETVAHVKRRVQFGKPLADLQLVQAAVAEMTTELVAARLLVASAAAELEANRTMTEEGRRRLADRASSMAKMVATESAQRIVDRAVQLHGGMGVALGSKVEQLYREIRPLRIYEGATDVLKLIIAQSVLR
ncbi:MAG TPA: acyl-CoA dehydrogenase [Polyangiaceae bacterium]